jgi:tetratricopeptide (TPR) repeat protein
VSSLLDSPLPSLLVALHRDRFSGALTLAAESVTRRFEWRAGLPVGVTSSLSAESLTETLVRAGALPATERARVAEAMRARATTELAARGASELAALGGLGVVAPRALLLGLAEQLRRTLLASLAARAVAVKLEPQPAEGSAPALPFDLLAVIFEGTAASYRAHEALSALGEHAMRFPRLARGVRAPWLPEGPARALLGSLDGRRAAFALLDERREPECTAALWLLDALGGLEYSERPACDETENAPRIEVVIRGQREAGASAEAKAVPGHGRSASSSAAPAEAGLRQRILDLHRRLPKLTLWEVLGVERGASGAEIRRAYLDAAKRMHPDRLAQLGLADLKEPANEVFAEIARAHEILSDPEQRQHYEATLGDAKLADADRVAEAEAAYLRGEHLMRAGNFRGALEFLERAVALWPDEADYQAALGWALHRKTPAESLRALEHFDRAFGLGTQQAVWWLRASLVARSLGAESRAQELAARARELDPNAKP